MDAARCQPGAKAAGSILVNRRLSEKSVTLFLFVDQGCEVSKLLTHKSSPRRPVEDRGAVKTLGQQQLHFLGASGHQVQQ